MNYLKLSTMEYAFHEGDIRLEHPDIPKDQTGDTFPAPEGYALVKQTAPPKHNPRKQYLTQSTPIKVGKVWQSVWVVNDMTPEQVAELAEARKPPVRKNRPPTTNKGSTPDVIA